MCLFFYSLYIIVLCLIVNLLDFCSLVEYNVCYVLRLFSCWLLSSFTQLFVLVGLNKVKVYNNYKQLTLVPIGQYFVGKENLLSSPPTLKAKMLLLYTIYIHQSSWKMCVHSFIFETILIMISHIYINI
jgi:hypothetical protein